MSEHRGVQEIEHVERDGDTLVEADAELTVPHGRRVGPHGVVLDQGPWPEMAHANAPEQALHRLEREGAGENAVERTWNSRSGGVVVRETHGGEREVGLGRHPGRGPAGSSSERGSGEIDGPFLGPPGISKMWVCPVSHELEVHRRDAACLAVF